MEKKGKNFKCLFMLEKDNVYDMHYGTDSFAYQKAKEFRTYMTEAEKILWEELRNNKFFGLKFRRQHPIRRFVVDFYCHKYKLVVEIDGEIHEIIEVKIKDKNREDELKELGLKILRIKNSEIVENMALSLDKI
jgi:very-short-patch-repair endonuclease